MHYLQKSVEDKAKSTKKVCFVFFMSKPAFCGLAGYKSFCDFLPDLWRFDLADFPYFKYNKSKMMK